MIEQINNMSLKKREPYIDNARAIAILAVVLSHAMSQIISMRGDTIGLLCEHVIVMFDMPLFTIIAGYCGLSSLIKIDSSKSLIDYLFKQWKRIMLPAGFLCVLFYCCSGGLLDNPIRLLCKFVYPGMFWYLIMLFVVFSYIGITSFITNRIGHYRFAVICLISLLVLPLKFIYIGEMMPYFVLGMILRSQNIINKLRINRISVLLLLIVCIILVFVYEYQYDVLGNFYNIQFLDFLQSNSLRLWILRFIICSIMSVFIMFACKFYDNDVPFLTRTGRITLPIYTISSVFLYIFRLPVINEFITSSSIYMWAISEFSHRVISLLFVFSLIIIVSEIIIFAAEKYKWSRILLLGK